MNDFSFSEGSLAGVPAEGFQDEPFSPQLQVEDSARVTGLESVGEITQQNFKIMDVVEPPPPIGSDLDFGEAAAVYDTLEDGPTRFSLFNELDKWERRQVLDNYKSPLGDRERKEYQQKVERLDALGMDWKEHPEARKKVVEAYGEEWTQAFEAVPDEHKGRVRGEKVLEEFYSRTGDGDADSLIRFLSSVDAPEGIRGSKDVWDRWFAGREPFLKAQEKEIETGRSFAGKAFPVIQAMMNGEGFLQALGQAKDLTPEENNFAMLNCGYGTPWGQSIQHAAQWLQGRGFDLHPEAAVERRAKELAEAYAKERRRYVSSNESPLNWGRIPNPFAKTMEDFIQEARDEMTGNVTDANVFDFAKGLLDLRAEDPMAAEAVIGLYKADAERLRNDSTLFVSPFTRTMRRMMESSSSLFEQLMLGDVREGDTVEWQPTGDGQFAPTIRNNEGKQVYRVLSQDQNEMISLIRAMQAEISESPDGSWWIRRQFDGLGRMAAQTSYFLATRGMGTFTSVANDRLEELRAQGVSPLESLLRAGVAGGVEVGVERLGGEFFGRNVRWLAGKFPGAQRVTGLFAGPLDAIRRPFYRNTGMRYGALSAGSGISEWSEEFIGPTLQAPLDAGLARLFGSSNGMTVEDWKGQLKAAADPDLGFQMMLFGGLVGGFQVPALAREAQISRVSAPQIMGLGVDRTEAERIANIVDPVEKNREILQAALSMSDRASQLENVRQGFSSMKEDFSWLARQEAYQAEVELLNLPRVEDLGDGSWRFTTTVRDAEGKESYDALDLNEQDATARMQALLHDGVHMRMLEAQQVFAVDKTIGQLEGSGKYVFEDMGRAETVETARKLAEAARLRIAEGADVNAGASDLGTRMTYGQAASMDETFKGRVDLGVERGEVFSVERAHSNAYRVAMRNGQTLIRFHKGEVTVPELLEEVLETHLTEDMENTKHSMEWYAANLRALQDALRKEGYLGKGKDLIRRDGEATMKDVIEGMSMLAKGDVLARAADMRLPQWMKDFLQMVRQWVSSAKALLDLGAGLHEMERRRLAGESVPIDANFAHTVYALSNNLESYWIQEGARQGEAAMEQIVKEVSGDISMSLSPSGHEMYNASVLKADQDAWTSSLDEFLEHGTKDPTTPMKVCSMPDVLSAMGIAGRDLVMSPRVIEKVMHGKHNLTREQMLQIPEALHNPILIVDSATQSHSLAILTAIRTDEGNVLVALHLDKNTMRGTHHVIASAYGKKNGSMIIDQMKAGHTRFLNKKRALAWARSARLQLPGVASQKGKPNVLEPEGVVKWKDGNNAAGGVSMSLHERTDVTPEEMLNIQQRRKEWLFPESIEMAREKSREEIFQLFGNELEPIAVIPTAYVHLFDSDLMNNRVYSGKGYFLDHALNHHPEVALEDYQKLQDILSHADEVALDNRDSGKIKLVFIKKYDKYGVVVVELGEAENDKLFFHKTFFNKRSKPYPKLKRLNIEEPSSVDGPSTIGQTSKEAPGRDLSALDDVSLIADSNRDVNDSSRGHDISLSLVDSSESFEEVCSAWKQQLDDYIRGKVPAKCRDLRVGPTPAVLRMLGANAYDLMITPAVLDKVTAGKHAIPVSELERLPEALHKPIAVFESVTQGNSFVVLTELKEGDYNVVVAVHLDAEGINRVRINRIASLYGKDNPSALLNMPLLYKDKKKTDGWLTINRLQLPATVPSSHRTKRKVMTPKDLFKWKESHDLSTTMFSLSEDIPLAVSRGTQNLEVVHRIAADLRADAATWGRYAGKTDEAAFMVNVGRNISLVKSSLMHLPPGYRVAVKPYIDRLQILAELAGKGKIDETRLVNAFARREIKREMADATREDVEDAEITAKTTAARVAWENGKKPTQKLAKEVFEDEMEKVRKAWAENRLYELMAEVMEKTAGKLEALAKDGISTGIARMLDQVLKVRKKKGKISAEAYTYLAEQVVPILRMTAEEKETAIREAEAELKKLEEENPDQIDGEVAVRVEELDEELTRLSLYGNLEGMSVDEAETSAKAIETFIRTEKEQWAAAQEAAAERLNAIGRKIVDVFNQTGKKADENTLRAANEKFSGKVSYKDVGDFMENMDQLLTRMGAMPALKEFTEKMRDRLTNAFQQMRDARGMRAAAVQDLYEKHITEKVMNTRKVRNLAGWATWFKTSHDTGVKLSGWVSQTAQLTLEQAREVREMDSKQRKEFIRKRWEEGMEYFSEETLDILLARLKEYEEAAARAKDAGKRAPYRKYVTAKVSFQGEESSPLVMSRDNALQVVLLSEQESYREMMKQQGYTSEVIASLRKYVGEEGMEIGYGLREMLKVQGDKIGKLYEQVTGVPFPREMNYYPARFWVLDAMSDADAADMISGVPSTKGGNKAWQYVRTKHHRRLDTSVGALSVFWEATDITEHWYYTQDITTDFRGLLKRREVAESLVANLGKDDFVRLRRWVDLLERAGVVQGHAVGSVDKLMNAVYSGQAKAILAFRVETLLKQGSAVLNAWIGDPSIGLTDYLFTMAKMRNNTAEMGVIKMLKSPEFQARLNGKMDVEVLSRLKDDSSYTLAEAALVWGMNGIEYTDVFFNAVGSAALWNIKYRQALKSGMEEGAAKDEAWQSVRNALHSAQPQSWIDKSFGGLNRGTWGRVIFYMMSENFNKTAAIYGLARIGFTKGATPEQRRGSLSKAGKVWLAYGAFNAIIGAMLDYMKDDEDEWEKRDWKGYLWAAIAGPLSGMPIFGEAVEWLCSLAGMKVYTGSAGRTLIDIRSGWNAGAKLWDMMQEGDHEFQEYMKQVIRLGRVFGAMGGIASSTANKTVQAVGQYMTLGAALMNPVKTVADIAE